MTHPTPARLLPTSLASLGWSITLLFLLVAVPAGARGQEGLAVGQVPAEAVLQTLDGEPVKLAEIIGEGPALVEFWATWCPVCRALEPRIQAAHQRFGEAAKFVIVAVGVGQNPASIRTHLERHPQPGHILWDARGAAVRAFDAPGTGIIYVLDREGRVAYRGAGTDQDFEQALEEVTGG